MLDLYLNKTQVTIIFILYTYFRSILHYFRVIVDSIIVDIYEIDVLVFPSKSPRDTRDR